MEFVAADNWNQIFRLLSVFDLFNGRKVCKLWRQMISECINPYYPFTFPFRNWQEYNRVLANFHNGSFLRETTSMINQKTLEGPTYIEWFQRYNGHHVKSRLIKTFKFSFKLLRSSEAKITLFYANRMRMESKIFAVLRSKMIN